MENVPARALSNFEVTAMDSRLALGFALCCLALPSISVADWQFTQWGMTMDEALAASKGSLIADDNASQRERIAKGAYTTDGLHFDAMLFFGTDDKLKEVSLANRSIEECARAHRAVQDKYGKGEVRDGAPPTMPSWIWRDEKAHNLIQFDDLEHAGFMSRAGAPPPPMCALHYKPLSSVAQGL